MISRRELGLPVVLLIFSSLFRSILTLGEVVRVDVLQVMEATVDIVEVAMATM